MTALTQTQVYALSVFASFVVVFLKGFQHKNVIQNQRRWVFVTSYLMAFIIKGGWPVALTSGTGAALGMVSSMWAHDWLMAKKRETP